LKAKRKSTEVKVGQVRMWASNPDVNYRNERFFILKEDKRDFYSIFMIINENGEKDEYVADWINNYSQLVESDRMG
jgi:hypothetical protein